jgi:microcystin degradation protein MlrC
MKRIAIGGIVHETNTFVPRLTTLDNFTLDDGEALVTRWQGSRSSLGGALHGLREAGYEPVPLLYTTAMPSGTVAHEAYKTLLNRLLERLETVMPIDGVLLVLHGAMVAKGHDDCEGEILARVRSIIGADCPLVSVLDMHGNLTPAMTDSADVLVAFNKNPHTDTYERGLEAAHILRRLLDEGLQPAHHLVNVPLLLSALTTATARLPLKAMHDQAEQLRRDPRVVNISIMGGFAYADVPYAGVSVLVTTDNDAALAQEMAQSLADTAWQHREAAKYTGISIDDAVARAIKSDRHPVILADVGDNVGGGSPGDSTFLLQALLDAGAQDAVVTLADAEAVAECVRAGDCNSLTVNIGGKQDTMHGETLRLQGIVECLTDGRFTAEGNDHFANIYGREVEMGRCAVLREDGVRILLTEHKTPPGDLAQLRSQGIIPEAQKIIVVKSAVAFRGAYEPIAGEIFEVDTRGLCAASLHQFPYRKLRRPIYPLDSDF